MTDKGELPSVFRDIANQVTVLAISGAAGAAFKAILAPEKYWRRRIVQGIGGLLSAVFLGGLVGSILQHLTDAGFYAYSAAGFIMGSGGEAAVRRLQEKLLGGDREK